MPRPRGPSQFRSSASVAPSFSAVGSMWQAAATSSPLLQHYVHTTTSLMTCGHEGASSFMKFQEAGSRVVRALAATPGSHTSRLSVGVASWSFLALCDSLNQVFSARQEHRNRNDETCIMLTSLGAA